MTVAASDAREINFVYGLQLAVTVTHGCRHDFWFGVLFLLLCPSIVKRNIDSNFLFQSILQFLLQPITIIFVDCAAYSDAEIVQYYLQSRPLMYTSLDWVLGFSGPSSGYVHVVAETVFYQQWINGFQMIRIVARSLCISSLEFTAVTRQRTFNTLCTLMLFVLCCAVLSGALYCSNITVRSKAFASFSTTFRRHWPVRVSYLLLKTF